MGLYQALALGEGRRVVHTSRGDIRICLRTSKPAGRETRRYVHLTRGLRDPRELPSIDFQREVRRTRCSNDGLRSVTAGRLTQELSVTEAHRTKVMRPLVRRGTRRIAEDPRHNHQGVGQEDQEWHVRASAPSGARRCLKRHSAYYNERPPICYP